MPPKANFQLPFPHPVDGAQRRANAEYRRSEKMERRGTKLAARKQGDRKPQRSGAERKAARAERKKRRENRRATKLRMKRKAGIMSDTSATSSDAESDLDTNSDDSSADEDVRAGVFVMRSQTGRAPPMRGKPPAAIPMRRASGDPDRALAAMYAGGGGKPMMMHAGGEIHQGDMERAMRVMSMGAGSPDEMRQMEQMMRSRMAEASSEEKYEMERAVRARMAETDGEQHQMEQMIRARMAEASPEEQQQIAMALHARRAPPPSR